MDQRQVGNQYNGASSQENVHRAGETTQGWTRGIHAKCQNKDHQNISDSWHGATYNWWRSGSQLSEPPQFASDDCASTNSLMELPRSSRHNLDVEWALRCSIAYWLLFCLSSTINQFDAPWRLNDQLLTDKRIMLYSKAFFRDNGCEGERDETLVRRVISRLTCYIRYILDSIYRHGDNSCWSNREGMEISSENARSARWTDLPICLSRRRTESN